MYNTLKDFYFLLDNAYKNAIALIISFSLFELHFNRGEKKHIAFLKSLVLDRSIFSLYRYNRESYINILFFRIRVNLSLLQMANLIKVISFLIVSIMGIIITGNEDQYKLIFISLGILFIYSVFFFDHEIQYPDEEEE